MKGKLVFVVCSLLLLVGCGGSSEYEDLIENTVNEVESRLVGSHEDLNVRENAYIYIWDNGRYIGITLNVEDMSQPDYFYEIVDGDYEQIRGYEIDQLMEREPDYREQFGEEI
ncbi:hypothetical protein KFZ58_03950 [Virgibacillus sp. NKC19-16]|uniref:hypothetical protein n=1 Tax=Virgibacillus salidurans TaxID=2831673 RepID=UPI001F1900FA|nr:hypothetical protein [Virgibacillus sp. NKC19-16]UJL47096.1 hypothetical protein KFZ58_03950 [Virgibacillus sp. NKC19-16]